MASLLLSNNPTGYTEINAKDLADPSLSLLNLLFKNSAQAIGTTQQKSAQTDAQVQRLNERIAILEKQVIAMGQPSSASAAKASGINAKGQAQQSVNTVNALVGTNTPVISVSGGGTGQSSLSNHGVIIGQGTSKVSVVTPGAAGTVLTSNGTNSNPSFQDAQLLGTEGIGNGAAGPIDAPAQGSGGGPATLQVVDWIQVKINNGTSYWIPLFQ